MTQDRGGRAGAPARRRRKEARPAEIVAAAIEEFADKGYGAARLEDVARRAGVAKGTVFVYFPTKPDLFRAVARSVLEANFDHVLGEASAPDAPLAVLVHRLLDRAADVGDSPVAGIVRVMIAEARTFPDIAQVWHDEVVAKLLGGLTAVIARAQVRGEVRPGDPRLHALSIFGPMLAAFVFRQVFGHTDAELPDLKVLAAQHAATVIKGLAP